MAKANLTKAYEVSTKLISPMSAKTAFGTLEKNWDRKGGNAERANVHYDGKFHVIPKGPGKTIRSGKRMG